MLKIVHCPVHVQLQTLESHYLAFYKMKASKDFLHDVKQKVIKKIYKKILPLLCFVHRLSNEGYRQQMPTHILICLEQSTRLQENL